MSSWYSTVGLLTGGSQQVKGLQGLKVRTRCEIISARLYDPIHRKQSTRDLQANAEGFFANINCDGVIIVFPLSATIAAGSLESLRRSGLFQVVVVNIPTFEYQFEVNR